MMDVISRQQAIDATWQDTGYTDPFNVMTAIRDRIKQLPTIQPEPHEIGYDDCANALLKMWMDDVLTDGEYYRIADKLNKKWGKTELPEPYKGGDNMTKREFLNTVFALAPKEANAIMDAFDKYVESNEPHWIPVNGEVACNGEKCSDVRY